MPDPDLPPATTRIPAVFPPRWGFWKGLVTGAVIEVPALAGGVWLLAQAGIGDDDAGFMRVLRLAAVFAGVASVLTAGGIGRLAAVASVARLGPDRIAGGRRRAVLVAARTHAAASAGLIVIAAIPLGHLPDHAAGWLPYPLFGAAAGAACGAVIGLVCGGAAPVGFADVWSLARTPGAALRQLLDPEDLARFGSALRQRTSTLFEGMFEPAKRPPEAAPPSASDDKDARSR
jgi:hypothetical protein